MAFTLLKKIIQEGKQKRLFSKVGAKIRSVSRDIRWIASDPASNMISLHCPEYVEPCKDKEELKIVQRIFQSFKKIKEEQRKAPDFFLYMPSSLWQSQLDKAYSYLTSGLRLDDISMFHFFLANFGAWKIYHGVESTTLIRENMTSFLKRRYLKNDIFYRQLKVWKWIYNDRKPISCLSYPMYGNQMGAYIDGVFVGVGSFFQ